MSDIERKVFRIIFNKTLSHDPVTLKLLKIKTGRTEKELRQIVKNLIVQNRIIWDKEKNKWFVYMEDKFIISKV
ncbi:MULTISPECIES: hypothetical protein [Bacillus]|uniref:Uncharacterized protein n=2 Tax=Bacillus TaxID=1386 RepID=A0A0M4FEV4_9BACI|nr:MULTISPECIES: hypothetical protein [Bacillus]ALC80787.1 hypothetical protein AM592_03670 [Bacillus gobiensis]MBP1079697.1 hypothetical protein [Bacillus capparidis]MED1095098.1 hypothetical protein [Bacillus capparidis]